MLATAIIVFREVLEAALVIGIVFAATRGIPGRSQWINSGIGIGVILAAILALLADQISALAAGVGQELLNAGILFAAVAMLTWHIVWMRKHGAEIARHMKQVGADVVSGQRPLYVLAVVVGLATLREGAEVVLFLSGIAAGGSGKTALLAGGLIGLLAGGAVGFILYFGLLRIPMRHLFSVSTWLIILLAAGMASQGAAYLVQADILPTLGDSLWNTSHLLSDQSIIGQILHTLVGYVSRPTGIQVLFYVGTLVAILIMMRFIAIPDRAASH